MKANPPAIVAIVCARLDLILKQELTVVSQRHNHSMINGDL